MDVAIIVRTYNHTMLRYSIGSLERLADQEEVKWKLLVYNDNDRFPLSEEAVAAMLTRYMSHSGWELHVINTLKNEGRLMAHYRAMVLSRHLYGCQLMTSLDDDDFLMPDAHTVALRISQYPRVGIRYCNCVMSALKEESEDYLSTGTIKGDKVAPVLGLAGAMFETDCGIQLYEDLVNYEPFKAFNARTHMEDIEDRVIYFLWPYYRRLFPICFDRNILHVYCLHGSVRKFPDESVYEEGMMIALNLIEKLITEGKTEK